MSRPPANGPIRFIAGKFLTGSRDRADCIAKTDGAWKTTRTVQQNARRMVASWNACINIPVEVLELYALEEAKEHTPEYRRRKWDEAVKATIQLCNAMDLAKRED